MVGRLHVAKMPVEFRELTLYAKLVRRFTSFLAVEEHPPHHFALGRSRSTRPGNSSPHGRLDFLGRRSQPQRLQCLDQLRLFFRDWMLILAGLRVGFRRLRLNSTGSPLWPMPVCRISRHFCCKSASKTGRLQDS